MFLGENPLGGQKCYRTERKGTIEKQCDDMTGEENQCTNHSDTTWAPNVPGIIKIGMTRESPALQKATIRSHRFHSPQPTLYCSGLGALNSPDTHQFYPKYGLILP